MAGLSYAVAFSAVAVSFVLRWTFAPFFGENVPFLHLYPAIIGASWFGGFGPGLCATAAAALGADYYFLPPAGIGVARVTDVVSLTLFAATGLVIAGLNHRLHAAQRSLRDEAATASSRAERLGAIINTTVDGIIVIDSNGAIEAFNPGAERLFGYLEAEAVGLNVSVLMPSPYREGHDGYLERYQRTGKAAIIGKGRQVRGRRKDGSVFPLHLSVGEMRVDGQRKFTGMLHDLTARVALESQLREQSALAKLGEMAAVIAHEVKNPLAGIRGAVQVIGSRLPTTSSDAQIMKEVVSRIDSLDDMMKDLLVFARPPTPRPTQTEIVPLVQLTAELLKRDHASQNVQIHINGAAPPVAADPDMLTMVVQNLLINGMHAIGQRGTIRVDVGAADGHCTIAVSDSGPGIPEEMRDQVFVPFFTTKSRGTGLGLPTVKRFVEAHHGTVTITCPPAGGTRVTVSLPRAEPLA